MLQQKVIRAEWHLHLSKETIFLKHCQIKVK